MISVIVPVHNVEKNLNACIDSILASTYKDFEVILVDDESTDQSGEICDSYQEKDKRIRVIHNVKKYRGPSEARNLGIKEAKGEYLAFVDSDDEIHPRYLETLICGIESNSADVSMVDNWWKIKDKPDEDTKKSETWIIVDESNDELALLYQETGKELIPVKSLTPPWGKIFRKNVFDNIEFPVDLYYEDEYVVHRWLYQSKRLCYCNQKLYYYYDRTDGITGAHNDKRTVDTVGALLDRARMFTEKEVEQEVCYKAVHSWMWFLIEHYAELTTKENKKLYLKSARNNTDLIRLLCNSRYYSIYYHLWLLNPSLAMLYEKVWKKIKYGKEQSLVTRRIAWLRNKYIFYKRNQLVNKSFSLIANNCNGGLLYHNLGVRFNSPFINLWLNTEDFIKICSDLKAYMDESLEFIKLEGIDYPVARLRDVTIYFMHYSSEEEAFTKWEERKARLNYNNLFVLHTQRNTDTLEQLKSIDDIKIKKVILTNKKYNGLSSAYRIRQKEPGEPNDLFAYLSRWQIKPNIWQYDFVKFFNSNN